MEHEVPHLFFHCLADTSEGVRVATVWCIINLAWREPAKAGAPQRIAAMRELGLEATLQEMQLEDASLDIKERVRTALEYFKQADSMAVD